MAKRVNEPLTKRTPDAPCTISDALNDIQQLDNLMKEMSITSDHTAIQKLIKSTIQNHWVQSIYWANKQGITEEELDDAMEEQEEASEQSTFGSFEDRASLTC